MKRAFASLLVAALALCLWAGASAEGNVYFSGDANVRSGPGKNYDPLGSVGAGSSLPWLGDTQADERGVDWYEISWDGGAGWVSSRYATLY